MKLLGYELYKVLKRRTVILIAILLCIINVLLYINGQYKENSLLIQYHDRYKQLEQSYIGLPISDGKRLTTEQVDKLILYGQFVQAYVNPKDSPWQSIVSNLKKDNKKKYEEYEKSSYFNQDQAIIRDTYLINLLKLQFENADQFQEKVDSMDEEAKKMMSVSIFNQKDTFSYRNITKTVKDFKPLYVLPFQLGLEEGIVTGTNFWLTDFCMTILIFLLITVFFYIEKDEGLIPLIRATKHGKLRTFGAKLVAFTLSIILVSLIYYGSILLTAEQLFGFGNISRYIQSMSSFYRAVEPLTVKNYIVLYILFKSIVNVLVGWLIVALFLGLGHISRIFITVTVLVGVSYLCYSTIHPNSFANILKYINIFSFYDTFHLISDYRNLNIIGFPVRKDTLTLYVWGGMMIILPTISAWLFVRMPGSITKPANLRWVTRWTAFLWKKRRVNSLFLHEAYKLLIVGKSVFIVIFALIIMYLKIDKVGHQFDLDSGIYNSYITQLDGKLSQEKLSFISQERDKFTTLPQKLVVLKRKLTDKQIDLITYNQEKFKVQEYLKREKAFHFVELQRDYLIQLQKEHGVTGSFVNSISSDALFNRQQDNLRDGMIYMLLLITGLGPLFGLDFKSGMMSMIWSSSKGRQHLFIIRHIIAHLFAICLFVLMQIPKFYNVISYYPKLDWSAPVQSIEVLEHVNWSVSILTYVIVTSLLQVLGVLMLAHVILYVALLVKKQSFLLIVATLLTILPLCLQYMGFTIINKFSFNFLFAPYDKFENLSYATGINVYYGLCFLIGMVVVVFSWFAINKFKGREN